MSTKAEAGPPLSLIRSEAITGVDVLIVIPSLNEEAHIESVIVRLQADRRCREVRIRLWPLSSVSQAPIPASAC
jgi:hypothetical protein